MQRTNASFSSGTTHQKCLDTSASSSAAKTTIVMLSRGSFGRAGALDERQITGFDADELNELLAWFSQNLKTPTSFGRGKLSIGVCWFKTSAAGHVSRIWKMVNILERATASA